MEQREIAKKKLFPELLKYQRELRGWSQAKMADEIGASPNRISSWERGVALPTAYFREKLCTMLEMNAQELGLVAPTKEVIFDAQEPESPEEQIAPSLVKTLDILDIIEQPQQFEDRLIHPVHRSYIEKFVGRRLNWIVIAVVVIVVLLVSLLVASSYGVFDSDQTNPYPPHTGRLILNDALRDQSSNVNWQEGVNDQQASCVFKEGGYVAFQPLASYFHACIAQKTDYTNFAYEVQMTIQQGEFGGIVFRSEDSIDTHYYLFRVHTDGSYWLYRFVDRTIEHAVLLDHGSVQTFNKGVGKTNRIAVITQASSLTLYINAQKVSMLQDIGYTHGQIGVLAGSTGQSPSQAIFRDAKVWTW